VARGQKRAGHTRPAGVYQRFTALLVNRETIASGHRRSRQFGTVQKRNVRKKKEEGADRGGMEQERSTLEARSKTEPDVPTHKYRAGLPNVVKKKKEKGTESPPGAHG